MQILKYVGTSWYTIPFWKHCLIDPETRLHTLLWWQPEAAALAQVLHSIIHPNASCTCILHSVIPFPQEPYNTEYNIIAYHTMVMPYYGLARSKADSGAQWPFAAESDLGAGSPPITAVMSQKKTKTEQYWKYRSRLCGLMYDFHVYFWRLPFIEMVPNGLDIMDLWL